MKLTSHLMRTIPETPPFADERAFAFDLVEQARQRIDPYQRNTARLEIYNKGHQDLVTQLDFEMEGYIKEGVTARFPEDAFIGEEAAYEALTDGRTWVCDPLDGTVNFVHGIPNYGIQLALLVDKEPVVSCICLPAFESVYSAARGLGLTCNGIELETSQTAVLAESCITFGDYSKSNPSSRGFQNRAMGVLAERALRVRIQGASSVDFAFVAAGKTGAHILFSKNIWEQAPGILLVQEGGGSIGHVSGAGRGFEGHALIAAANDGIRDAIIDILEAL